MAVILNYPLLLWPRFFPFLLLVLGARLSQSLSLTNEKTKVLIIGLGRVGRQVANVITDVKPGVPPVFGTVRSAKTSGVNICKDESIVSVPFDATAVRDQLMGCRETNVVPSTHVLFTIPLSKDDDPKMEAVVKELKEWWKASDLDQNQIQKVLGIVSTTGVYGNHDGRMVTEESPLLCEESSNAALYRRFEDDWISLTETCGSKHRRLVIFRSAGIYDSTRSALHTVYKQFLATGKLPTQSKPGNKTNRIHISDLANSIVSGIFGANLPEISIYNLADNLPESRSIVLSYASELLASIGVCATEEKVMKDNVIPSSSSKTRQGRRERESKLVSNQLMRDDLLMLTKEQDLLYPTYQEGLDAIFEDPTTPWRQCE